MQNLPPLNKKESLLKGIIVQIIITKIFNTLFAVFNYQISLWYLPDNIDLAKEFGKTGTYIAIMLAPIFYAILYNNFFLPIKSNKKMKGLDKFKPNKWLLILMFVALVLTVITLVSVDSINLFFDFKTKNIPAGLVSIFIINAILPTLFIFAFYKLNNIIFK
ncbi:hypothetical protein [Spiroplasma taiwanense]|uniref:hypothetical protein n=1 Tax=Spiroplasma taiwanense TaxID=2145 RepID=UPI0004247261|nr:hypothetical protein [Spiroplasma taiwanense]